MTNNWSCIKIQRQFVAKTHLVRSLSCFTFHCRIQPMILFSFFNLSIPFHNSFFVNRQKVSEKIFFWKIAGYFGTCHTRCVGSHSHAPMFLWRNEKKSLFPFQTKIQQLGAGVILSLMLWRLLLVLTMKIDCAGERRKHEINLIYFLQNL